MRRVRRISDDVLAFDPEIVRRLASGAERELFRSDSEEIRRVLPAMRAAWTNELTDCQRLYLTCYYRKTMTMRAIAAQYDVNISTVSRTLKRGRTRLRRILQYYI